MTDRIATGGATSRSGLMVGRPFLRLAAPVLMLAVLYGAAYGVARWRKYIVMTAYCNKEGGLIVRHPQPGFDLRSGWRGQARNDAMFAIFRPLCALEVLLRGDSTPDR
jgi:hypothetical protein